MAEALGYEGQKKRVPYSEIPREFTDPARGNITLLHQQFVQRHYASAANYIDWPRLADDAGVEVESETIGPMKVFMLGTTNVNIGQVHK